MEVIQEYLIRLGATIHPTAISRFQGTLEKLDRSAERHMGGIAGTVLKAEISIVGAFTAISSAIVTMIDKVAMADQSYRLMGLRMLMTTEQARKMDMITKALGVDLATIVWDQESHERAVIMAGDIDRWSAALGGDFEGRMKRIRDVRFEFSRLELAVKFLGMSFVSSLWAKLFPGRDLLATLDEWVTKFGDAIPDMAAKLSDIALPILKDTWKILKGIGEVVKEGAIAFTNLIGLLTGDDSIMGAEFSFDKLGKAILHVENFLFRLVDVFLRLETTMLRVANGAMLLLHGRFNDAAKELGGIKKELGGISEDMSPGIGVALAGGAAITAGSLWAGWKTVKTMKGIASLLARVPEVLGGGAAAAEGGVGAAAAETAAAGGVGAAAATAATAGAAESVAAAGVTIAGATEAAGATAAGGIAVAGGGVAASLTGLLAPIGGIVLALIGINLLLDKIRPEAAKKAPKGELTLGDAVTSPTLLGAWLAQKLGGIGDIANPEQPGPTAKLRAITNPDQRAKPSPTSNLGGIGDSTKSEQQPRGIAKETQSTIATIREAAGRYNLPPSLALAVAEQESRFRQDRVSPAGAIGVMQLMPATAADLGVDPHDREENIEGGVRYLSMLLQRYQGDQAKALAAYNAGPGTVDRGGPLPRETRNYVPSVLSRQEKFDKIDVPSAAEGMAVPGGMSSILAMLHPREWVLPAEISAGLHGLISGAGLADLLATRQRTADVYAPSSSITHRSIQFGDMNLGGMYVTEPGAKAHEIRGHVQQAIEEALNVQVLGDLLQLSPNW